ncbi:amidohydrolase family protein [Rhizohabitans arisaemae]|uniref:amidohydrolase family protein n=1 Tax=Rhizohabitans arisaemae TaxID=2720610 RepID=UPI0024B1F746|nr:amidohydrolase family protein [Rhizohabitans arisaemae]
MSDSYVIGSAYLISMDPAVGDLPAGRVRVDDGTITHIGAEVPLDGATVIDAPRSILMPGLIDTHWHLWNTVLRGVIADGPVRGYFPVKRRLARHFTPENSYDACRMALAEATASGITTVNNWDHNARSPEDVDAKLRAHRDMGLRTRYSYGNPDAYDRTRPMDLPDIARVKDELTPDGLLTLGAAVRGPTRTEPDVLRREWDTLRELGVPMTMHCGGRRAQTDRYADLTAMYRDGLLGPDLQIVHAVEVDDAEIELLAETGTHLTLSPLTEYHGMGIPRIGELLDAGIVVSLSIDTCASPLPADMFSQVAAMLELEKGRRPDGPLTPRRALEMATIDGARDLGIDHLTGSLTVGKRADLILLDADALNLAPCVDPIRTVAHCAKPHNVRLVMVDGRILKQDDRFTRFTPADVVETARHTVLDLLTRSGWTDFPAPFLF